MRSTMNRRALLRTAASAAMAASAGAVTIAAAGEHPDAELVALGAEFDRLLAEFKRVDAIYEAAYDPMRGLYDCDPVGHLREHKRLGLGPLGIACDVAIGAVDDIAARIREVPAAGMAGMAVKARVLRWDLRLHTTEPGDWEYEQEKGAAFCDEIERMAQAAEA